MISFHDLERSVDKILYGFEVTYALTSNDGGSIIEFKSLLKAEYKSAGKVVFEPIEKNSFATYNKTSEPREYLFTVALQFPNNNFTSALARLEELKKGVELFTFTTPYMNYYNLTLEGYAYTLETFTSMLIIELQCKEVLQVEQGYTNVTVNDATPINENDAKNPDNVSTSDTGITGTRSGTSEEQKQGNQSLILIANGGEPIIPGSNRTSGGTGGGTGDF